MLMTIGNPARTRRRLFAALAGGLVLALTGALPLQGEAPPAAPLFLALAALGAAIAVAASLALMALQLRAWRLPALGEELHDELANRNSVRAMALGYVVLVIAGGGALLAAAFLPIGALPALTAVLLPGIATHLASFAWFERQGDDD